MAARPFFVSSSCRRYGRCGRPGRLGTCSVAVRAWPLGVGGRPSAFFSAARTWPCLRSSPSSGGRPASLARRRLVDLRSARARFDLFLVGSLHLAQDAPFMPQLGSALLLGVMRLAEMSCCRRDGPRSIVRARLNMLVLLYASCLNFSTRLDAVVRGPRPHARPQRRICAARRPKLRASPCFSPTALRAPCAPRITQASPKDVSKSFHI